MAVAKARSGSSGGNDFEGPRHCIATHHSPDCNSRVSIVLFAGMGTRDYGTIDAHHIDEASTSDLTDKIIPRMDAISYEGSSSLILLCSPQALAEKTEFREAVFRCIQKRTLRLIVIDEAQGAKSVIFVSLLPTKSADSIEEVEEG